MSLFEVCLYEGIREVAHDMGYILTLRVCSEDGKLRPTRLLPE
jgi:hypothetical protein